MLDDAARILVTGGTAEGRARFVAKLRDDFAVDEGNDLGALEPNRTPELILVVGEVATIAAAREAVALAELPVVAMVDSADDVAAATAAGADDVMIDATTPQPLLIFRLRRQLEAAADRRSSIEARRCEEALLAVQRLAVSGGPLTETLREILLIAKEVLDLDRGSVILTDAATGQSFVVAATDDPTLSKFPVDLELYPELRAAIHGNERVLIGDAPSSAVFPIDWRGRPCGAVFYRAERPFAHRIGPRRVGFGRLVAGVIAQIVGGGEVLESLRDQTHRISLARYESEKRARAIEQMTSYFEAGSDGVLVVDGEGEILFVNHATEAITGWARDGLVGAPIADLVAEAQRDGVYEVIARVLAGNNLEAFDLDVTTTSGEAITVSVATSTVLSENGAAILSFRDVTAERALETELRKTKDFLEKMIDSTVDAIVAADVEGNVILFNPGAERLYGWRPDEAIGRLHVDRLYPEGVARQVMRMLRSPSYGGVGRLELTRREIVTKDGELVPVNMTASVIYEDGREVATVGILSDLRDRIRIEQRLLQAQEKLLITEKQAVVAELAGAAAHELNQPLTSVLLSVELMQKRMKSDDPHWRSLSTIYRETTRMAEIVKKIGKITRYETKAYVGSSNILDLDKSSEVGMPPANTEKTGDGGGGRGR